MALGTGLPRCFIAVRLRRLTIRGKYKFHEQPVLLYQAKLMAILTYHVPVTGKFPRLIRLFHEMATVAKLGVLLDIVVVADSKDNAQDRDNDHERDNNGLVPRAQAAFELVEYFGDEFVHGEKAFTAEVTDEDMMQK
jgi:hypothetical protein